MIKKIYLVACTLLAVAGVVFWASAWMQRSVAARPAEVMQLDEIPVLNTDALPALYPVAPFQFTDQSAATFSSEALKGKIWVGYLFFSTCPGQCLIMTESIRRVAEQYKDDDRVHFTGFSVDPERDTPERLKVYGEKYVALNPRWHFLTGPIEDVEKLSVGSFRLGEVDQPQFHSDKFVLVDGNGMVRGYYSGIDDAEVKKLGEAIGMLLTE